MVSLPKKAVVAALRTKFGFELDNSDHAFLRLKRDGVYIARTKVSFSHTELSDSLVGLIARQIGVSAGQLRGMVQCTIDQPGYLTIIAKAEHWPSERYGRR